MGVHARPGTCETAPTASEDGPPTACEDRDGPLPWPARTVDHRGVGAGALQCEYLETVDPLLLQTECCIGGFQMGCSTILCWYCLNGRIVIFWSDIQNNAHTQTNQIVT